MNKAIALIFLFGVFCLKAQQGLVENQNHVRGETLDYKIKYGWFKIGEARVHTDKDFHLVDGKPHYLVRFNLKTVGWLRIFADLDIVFESYVDTEYFRPSSALRSLKTSKKTNIQEDLFRYQDSIYVETYRREKDQTRINSYPIVGPPFTDALGTYMFIRGQALSDYKNEQVRFYIAHRVFEFEMIPDIKESSPGERYYKLIFPPIKQFPREKTNYAILEKKQNIPVEIKLATDNGNFYFILDQ